MIWYDIWTQKKINSLDVVVYSWNLIFVIRVFFSPFSFFKRDKICYFFFNKYNWVYRGINKHNTNNNANNKTNNSIKNLISWSVTIYNCILFIIDEKFIINQYKIKIFSFFSFRFVFFFVKLKFSHFEFE